MASDKQIARVKPPFGDQRFDTFDQWVSRASSWLTCHEQYNNTEHGDCKGWRGYHFTALCFDSFGRRCTHGEHFKRAKDEGAFPVWWIWPDQILSALANAEREGLRNGMTRAAEIVDAYPPEDFFAALDSATDCVGPVHEFRGFEGDAGNWAYLMSVLLKPYSAAILSEAKEGE